MVRPPCRECPDVGCGNHANCEKYLEYRRLKDAENQQIRDCKNERNISCDYIQGQTTRYYKRTGKTAKWTYQR